MKINKLPDDAVLIKDTIDEYVDPRGEVYGYDHRHGHKRQLYRKEKRTVCGYWVVPINYISGRKTCVRVHRLVAQAFIEKPDGCDIVMHLDNNKKNNNVSNLKWGTISMNTKQAFDDGLIINAKGNEDSQSIPCDMYETTTNKKIKQFESCTIASKQTGITVTAIRYTMNHPQAQIRKKYYFTKKDEGCRSHYIIIEYDIHTDKEICRYYNIGDAQRQTGISNSTISGQINKTQKPQWTSSNTYFKKALLEREEVIEINKRVE